MTKCTLKTTQVLLDADGHVLTQFNIYQGTLTLNCSERHASS